MKIQAINVHDLLIGCVLGNERKRPPMGCLDICFTQGTITPTSAEDDLTSFHFGIDDGLSAFAGREPKFNLNSLNTPPADGGGPKTECSSFGYPESRLPSTQEDFKQLQGKVMQRSPSSRVQSPISVEDDSLCSHNKLNPEGRGGLCVQLACDHGRCQLNQHGC